MSPDGNWDRGGCKVQCLGRILIVGNAKLRTLSSHPVCKCNLRSIMFLRSLSRWSHLKGEMKRELAVGQGGKVLHYPLRPTDIGLSSLRINAPCVQFTLTV